jgi:hypothetical protein
VEGYGKVLLIVHGLFGDRINIFQLLITVSDSIKRDSQHEILLRVREK